MPVWEHEREIGGGQATQGTGRGGGFDEMNPARRNPDGGPVAVCFPAFVAGNYVCHGGATYTHQVNDLERSAHHPGPEAWRAPRSRGNMA